MPRSLSCALLICGLFAPAAPSHGGKYNGPGDVPPAGGGGGTGTPGVGGPTTPAPGGPSSGGPAGPGNPIGSTPPPTTATSSGGVEAGPDMSAWQYWWDCNKEPYLRLKDRLGETVETGSDEFFLGRGTTTPSVDRLRATRARIREQVVPRLVRMLDEERSNDIQSGCMIALARIGDELSEDGAPRAGIATRLVRRLDDANQELAETAALALGILGDGAHAPLLESVVAGDRAGLRAAGLQAVAAPSLRTRAFAAYGLGQLGSRLAAQQRVERVAALQRALQAERGAAQPDVAMAQVAALGLMPLTRASIAGEHDPRAQQVRHLLEVFGDESWNPLVRAHVPAALGRLLADRAEDDALAGEVVEALLRELDPHAGANAALEQSAVLALGQLADCGDSPSARDARELLLRRAADDADEQVRCFALIALGQVGARPGTGRDWSGLAGPDGVRAFLVGRLASGKVATRSWAGLALAVLERGLDERGGPASPDARAALVACLGEARNPEQIGALAIATGIVRDRRAAAPLRASLAKVSDPEARGHLCVALGLLEETGAAADIATLVERSRFQPVLLKSAAIGLGLMRDRDVALQLVGMLQKAQGLSSQAAISSALGFIGDDRSIGPLLALLGDPEKTALARAFAAAALGIVGDKDDLPWGSRFSVDVNYRANVATLIDPGGSMGLLNLL